MIKVVVVDDHRLVGAGLRVILDADADMPLVGQAGDGLEARRHTPQLGPHGHRFAGHGRPRGHSSVMTTQPRSGARRRDR